MDLIGDSGRYREYNSVSMDNAKFQVLAAAKNNWGSNIMVKNRRENLVQCQVPLEFLLQSQCVSLDLFSFLHKSERRWKSVLLWC